MGADNGGAAPEQKTVLGFPARPPGDPDGIRSGRHYWYELAGEPHGVFADIDRLLLAIRLRPDDFDSVTREVDVHLERIADLLGVEA